MTNSNVSSFVLKAKTVSTVDCISGHAGWFKKSICIVVCTAMLNTLTIPLAQAYAQKRQQTALKELMLPSSADRYAQDFAQIEQLLDRNPPQSLADNTTEVDISSDDSSVSYSRIRLRMDKEARLLREEWQALRRTWQEAQISDEILNQQDKLEETFEIKHEDLMKLLKAAAEKSNHVADIQALATFFEQERPRLAYQPTNFENMPWQVEQPKQELPAIRDQDLTNKIIDKKDDILAKKIKQIQSKGTLVQQPVVEQRLAVNVKQQEQADKNSPPVTMAGVPFSTKAATAPSANDLASTLDAQQTAEIKALAQSLDNNPHKIYQWVHDNIHYFPSHGSVQGAQDTLDKKRGNAFDTNSLLIALLRSAGIPARYVYGSVEMPIDQVQNWVGDAATSDAAQQILSQGGVPNVLLVKGGKDFAFRLEHVWVEALIQYHPGRGATHKPGQSEPDTWIPMDGSFKQYTYTNGMNLQEAVPFDADALLAVAQQGVESNEAEGWVRGINSAAIEAQLKTYQNQLESHIKNNGQSTVGNVLGEKTAKIDPLPYLAGTLPYAIRARSQQFSEIPDRQRAKFKYEIYTDQRSAAWGDSPVLKWQMPTAAIAGKKITIAWVAASEADQTAIEVLIPTPLPGQDINPSKLPTGLSSSIKLKPEIRLDGETVATGPAFSTGDEPVGAGSFTRYGTNQWDTTTDQLITGQQTALGLSIQGVSSKQLNTLKTRMKKTQDKLEQAQAAPHSQREAILQGLTGENLTGDMLSATLLGYFASLETHGFISSSQAAIIDLPGLSYGLFHAQVKPRKLYGMVTTGVAFQGLNMDVGHLRSLRWVKDDNPISAVNNTPELTRNGKTAAQNRWIAYNKMRGQYASAMEHAVPEEFWVDKKQCRYTNLNGETQNPTQQACAEGISAVKAIAIAQQQGQKIYTINKDNRNTALPKLNISGEAGAEIKNAIMAGKEVIFHEKAISAHGWTGHGYIMVDPNTGAGAYIIEGSGNGGFLDLWSKYSVAFAFLLFIASLIAALASAGVFVTVILGILTVFTALMNIMVIRLVLIENGCPQNGSSFFEGMEWLAVVLSFLGAGGVAGSAFLSFLSGGGVTGAAVGCRSF